MDAWEGGRRGDKNGGRFRKLSFSDLRFLTHSILYRSLKDGNIQIFSLEGWALRLLLFHLKKEKSRKLNNFIKVRVELVEFESRNPSQNLRSSRFSSMPLGDIFLVYL